MAKTIISEGKTTAEAIEKGLKAIGLPKELVEIKVIDENKKSFFDILAPKVVKVELKEKEAKKPEEFEIETTEEELNEAKNKVEKFLKDFTEKLANGTNFEIEIKEKCLYVAINGENVGNLIGYRGEALYALENILKAISNKESENRVIVRLDIENYKEKRIKTLQEVANKKARIVEKTGKMITLEPMQAYERKIIHSFLQENPKVETRSIGQEPRRRIVISKK
ncbi:MAG: Jag N-terminal domain-containing protein [Clostridia bacterium]|nr:Jag N-terminal domain-containing protein [Clostridia bacterium]